MKACPLTGASTCVVACSEVDLSLYIQLTGLNLAKGWEQRTMAVPIALDNGKGDDIWTEVVQHLAGVVCEVGIADLDPGM